MRVGSASIEDLALVIGMNRLRAGYVELDPTVDRYFVTSTHDDSKGIWQTYNPLVGPNQVSNVLASSGTFITFVTSALAGAFAALVAVALGGPVWVVGAAAAAGGLAYMGGSLMSGVRSFRRITGRTVLFPSPGGEQ
jgi:hypothetical protein